MKSITHEGWIAKDIPLKKIFKWFDDFELIQNAYIRKERPKVNPENWKKIEVAVREVG